MESGTASAVVISEKDNVATATRVVNAGEKLAVRVGGKETEIAIRNDIKFLHKFALKDIKKGDRIFKYGMIMGEATADISRGEHVHVHNIRSLRGCI